MNTATNPVQDKKVIARLVEEHEVFLNFLKRRVDRPQDAEEILQTAFVKSLIHSESLRAADSAVAWFYRVLRNAIIDHHRHKGVQQRSHEALAKNTVPVEDPEIEQVLCTCFKALLPTLSSSYAEILRRVELEEESIAEFAASEGMTTGNVRVRLHRARKALHKRLEQVCGTCTLHGCLDCDCQK